ncbi:hypothetical protein VTO73DRAFT_2446 [Trametes versicolor]
MATEIFTPGAVYTLFNGQFGTVMEFDPSNGLVQAGTFAHKSCQQWEFVPAKDGFIIRCSRRNEDRSRVYLNFEGGLRGGEALRASSIPMVWNVAPDGDSDMVRIYFSSKFCVDLDATGRSRIQLWPFKSDIKSELWYPSRCDLDSFLQEPVGETHNEVPHDQTTNDAPPDIASRGAPGPGALVLVNVKSDSALALASDPNIGKPVGCKCFPRADTHKTPSDRLWTFIPCGAGFIVQSGALAADGQPLYLAIEGPAVAGAALAAKPYPVSWEVRGYEVDKTKTMSYRVYCPGTDLLLSPEKEGNKLEGTLVRLARCRSGVHELWRATLP